MKDVAVYVRVSTKGQELDNQLLQLRKYCEKSDWRVYKEYCDIASYDNKRPEYDKMFIDAHKKLFDVVLFWALDRFSRSGATYTLQKLKELENLGVGFHSYSEPYLNTDNEMYKEIVIAVMSSFAKLEREKISERTKAGLQRVKENGKKLGRPQIPIETIRNVLDYLDEGLSYRQISEKVVYKIKFGAERHISPAQISQIKHKETLK
jgi:DNA invertase Pin-like site-specific DNA recombinase